jgi:hypothetical protein
VRYTCKECGGGGICDHGRVRYTCKECGGGGICHHGQVRYTCNKCRDEERGFADDRKVREGFAVQMLNIKADADAMSAELMDVFGLDK